MREKLVCRHNQQQAAVQSPQHCRCQAGDVDLATILIKKSANVEARTVTVSSSRVFARRVPTSVTAPAKQLQGATPLIFAARAGQEPVARLLLERGGANPLAVDNDAMSALDHARASAVRVPLLTMLLADAMKVSPVFTPSSHWHHGLGDLCRLWCCRLAA